MAIIVGTEGNDSLRDTDAADVMYGLGGDDYLWGGLGADTLHGGDGDDRLYGGGYRDTYFGGAGFDIVDFIDNLTPVAVSASLATGLASFIGQGWPAESMTGIEGLVGGALADSLVGDAGDNYLEGRGGNDTIRGGAGNDELVGGSGADSLAGGAGDDTLIGHETWDAWPSGDTLHGGVGFDTASYSLAFWDMTIDLAAGTAAWTDPQGGGNADTLVGIEAAVGGDGRDFVVGTDAANRLEGGRAADTLHGGGGRDTLIGGTGDDVLWGGGGNDVLDGGDGVDFVLYHEVTASMVLDLAAGTASFPGTGWPAETLISVEGAEAGWGNDTLLGDDGANLLVGGAGQDSLVGGAGDDTLDGGDGRDTIDGGAGHDTVRFAGTTAMTVDLGAGTAWATANPAVVETLTSIEAVVGGAGGDLLIGGTGDDRLDGGAGADVLEGRGGADTLVGGVGDDTLRGMGGDDVFLVDAADGRELWYGDPLADDGRDVLLGGAGDNTLVVEDVRYFSPGDQTSFSAFVTSVIDLAAGRFSMTHAPASVDVLVAIENVVTADGADTIIGSAAGNRIDAGGGANVVHGGDGDDTIDGGSWIETEEQASGPSGDFIDGGAGNDLVRGNGSHLRYFFGTGWGEDPGRDTLVGGAGDDTLESGQANVDMTGGTGADAFRLTDEYVYSTYPGEGGYGFPDLRITDFSGGDGDTITFAMVESGASIDFVGEASTNDLALHQSGYTVEDGDTLLRIRLGADEWDILTLVLDDYAGGLTSDELAFV